MVHSLHNQNVQQILGGRILFLVGMMGSGKSNTGPHLATALNYAFVDSDKVIEKSVGKSISAIFSEDGEDEFREIEHQVLKEIGQHHSLIVATGGGVVTSSQNWGILHQGIVIWLNPERERLLTRLRNDRVQRPLLKGEDFVLTFDRIFHERKSLYMESDLEIAIQNESPHEVAEKIIRLLPGILKNPHDQGAPQTIGD